MKYKLLIILSFLSSAIFSQSFRGAWKGEIKEKETSIHVKFNVMIQKDSMVGAFMSEPKSCLISDSSYNGTRLHLRSLKEKMTFIGELTDNKNQLTGEFTFNGKTYLLDMFRGDSPMYTPQEPKKPYPYYSEDESFTNDSVTIAGTLTMPNTTGTFPAVILLSGSSPSNRDYESYYHKTFLVLADYLTRNGIAVLRCDDRGVNKSSGDYYKSTVVDLAKDAIAGYNYLINRKEILKNSIGVLGHSEGGVVASIAASLNKDFGFTILLASPGINIKENYILQTDLKFKCGDISKEGYEFTKSFFDVCYKAQEMGLDRKAIIDTLKLFKKQYLDNKSKNVVYLNFLFDELIKTGTSPHNIFNSTYNLSDFIEKVSCPVLSLGGTNDILVPADLNQEAIREALIKGGNTDFKILTLEGLNHNFQECKTGSMKESMNIEQTISPLAMKEILEWILTHTKK